MSLQEEQRDGIQATTWSLDLLDMAAESLLNCFEAAVIKTYLIRWAMCLRPFEHKKLTEWARLACR